MNQIMSNDKCPRCGLSVQPENRLIVEVCGHRKCKQCFMADTSECAQCLEDTMQLITKTPTPPPLPPTTATATVSGISTIGSRKHSQIAKAAHIKQHVLDTGEKHYECTVCCKKFKSRSQIYYHMACGKDGIKKYKCTHCDKTFSTKSHLCYHAISHKKESHICGQCGKKFTNFLLLARHEKLHNNAGQRCTECGKLYRSSLSLAAHKAQKHHIYSNNKNNNTCDIAASFKCNMCEKEYYQKSTLRQHMLKHYGKRFECHVCRKLFQRNSTLQRHLKRHAERTESFVCTDCFRNFSDIGSLLRHAKIHKGHMAYKCRHCHITSVRRDNMLRHVRNIHIGEKFQECVEELKITHESDEQIIEQTISMPVTPNTTPTVVESNELREERIEEIPKTVANSSVIKFVGNVEPMKIPECNSSTILATAPLTTTTGLTDLSDSEALYISAATVAHKKLKKKYDPIEMYRKILIPDENDDSEKPNAENNDGILPLVEGNTANSDCPSNTNIQRNNNFNTISNFSATHWRKNFKYTYEYNE